MVNIETRAGKPRLEALKNFATRTQVDDVRALVAMLVQTDRFGTSVAQALRTHAEESRIKRRQRAEENAAKLSVKLIFPLVFFLFRRSSSSRRTGVDQVRRTLQQHELGGERTMMSALLPSSFVVVVCCISCAAGHGCARKTDSRPAAKRLVRERP